MSRHGAGASRKNMGKCYPGSGSIVCGGDMIHRGQINSGVCADRPELVLAAMKTVLRYETEWAVTGEIFMDEEYLVAREIVRTRGGQW